MDGPTFRGRFGASIDTVCDTLLRHFSENNAETRQLIAAITEVGKTVFGLTNPEELRAPIIALTNLIAELEPAFFFDPQSNTMIQSAKMFVRRCMKLVGNVTQPAHLANAVPMPRAELTFADILAHFPVPDPVVPAVGSVIDLPVSTVSVPVAPKAGNRVKSAAVARAPAIIAGKIDKKKKCDHCASMIARDYAAQLHHAWKKHKDQVYKILRHDLVCRLDYCDHVGYSEKSKKVHEGRAHGPTPAAQHDVIQELEPGPCRYCGFHIDTLAAFKNHTLECKQRDSRAPLGCTGCNKEFHYIFDFIAHLRLKGGLEHGKPVPLEA